MWEQLPLAMNKQWHLPIHVFRRLEALLGGEEVKWLDADVDRSDGKYSGTVVCLTSTRVAIAQLTDAAVPVEDQPEAHTVRASAWSRATLRSLLLYPEDNPDDRWQDDYSDRWPYGARLTLMYEGQDPLKLPLAPEPSKHQRERFRALLPSLVSDLDGRQTRQMASASGS